MLGCHANICISLVELQLLARELAHKTDRELGGPVCLLVVPENHEAVPVRARDEAVLDLIKHILFVGKL